MSDPRAEAAAQLRNIEAATGRSQGEWTAVLKASGLGKHAEMVTYLKEQHGLTHGNANLLVTLARQDAAGGAPDDGALLAEQYRGPKAALRPVLDSVLREAARLGADVQVVVQKTGVSLRRAKQFALVRVPSAGRVELGLNAGELAAYGRLLAPTGMCTHRVDLHGVDDVDAEVVGWLRLAYDRAG